MTAKGTSGYPRRDDPHPGVAERRGAVVLAGDDAGAARPHGPGPPGCRRRRRRRRRADGLSAARRAAELGASVVLLEAERIGWGASTRNGGFCHPGFKQSLTALRRLHGQERAEALYRETIEAFEHVERLCTTSIDADFDRTGHLVLASAPSHAVGLRRVRGGDGGRGHGRPRRRARGPAHRDRQRRVRRRDGRRAQRRAASGQARRRAGRPCRGRGRRALRGDGRPVRCGARPTGGRSSRRRAAR